MFGNKSYDVLIIGGGQAGLAAGYFLKKTNLSFVILDQSANIGQSWSVRYDSLKLFTPNAFNSLPDLKFSGYQNNYPSKNEMAAYLQIYAKKFDLPVQLENQVLKLQKNNQGFTVATNKDTYYAKSVIIATGPFQKPYIPGFANKVDPKILQVHTATYKNPDQIGKGKTLIVGTGNSGAQIAVELSNSHEVTIAYHSKPRFLPQTFLGKSWLWWIKLFGLSYTSITKWPLSIIIGKWREPIMGIELKKLIRSKKIKLKPAVVEVSGNKIIFADKSQEEFINIIWATGFRYDFSWIKINGVLDNQDKPIHVRGISSVPNLYFTGLKYQTTVNSGLIHGAGSDAQYIIKKIIETRTKF